MRRIRLDLSYDGTDFSGWQKQKNADTVQSRLENALCRIHKQPAAIVGSGRTDAGVHAIHQVAHFDSDMDSIPADKYRDALNSILPPSVRICKSAEAHAGFHSRYDALYRSYQYWVYPGCTLSPFYRNYCWQLGRRPRIDKINYLAREFIGSHDFTSFTAAGDKNENKVKHIFAAGCYPHERFLVFYISGISFLWKMVRNIIGTILELELHNADASKVRQIFSAKDRKEAGITAPPQGLYLQRIAYEGEEFPFTQAMEYIE